MVPAVMSSTIDPAQTARRAGERNTGANLVLMPRGTVIAIAP
jgi:hypothetical protein